MKRKRCINLPQNSNDAHLTDKKLSINEQYSERPAVGAVRTGLSFMNKNDSMYDTTIRRLRHVQSLFVRSYNI